MEQQDPQADSFAQASFLTADQGQERASSDDWDNAAVTYNGEEARVEVENTQLYQYLVCLSSRE
jgi:hypothetical protein